MEVAGAPSSQAGGGELVIRQYCGTNSPVNPIKAQILQYKLAKAEAEAKDAEESLAANRTLNKIRVAMAEAEAKESLAAQRTRNKIRVAEAKADLAAYRKRLNRRAATAVAEAKADLAAHRKRLNNRVAEAAEAAEAARRARAAAALATAAPPPRDTSGGQTRDEDIGPAVMREMLMEVAAWAGYKDKAA
ncbi:hypothetical protein CHLRE_15g636100v5 [Chlamydomonas reinhardtii]|uniref:Uncharacterized protein n=1 Tax=Chlamydomonas reinhardtii TaxID=3055 RepID=A8JDW4_CHLRE|nr:uncharacterized protein CHLRE_15g636100v5 [Chlamydomonas reinhardtii]PNW72627.1 hypothetical protein CHLRE_15g636100v5 [Chlamydomonas reinhardtii]|eukprot:XP_001700610.1 hypothetical protein CHLREDRAFT_194186 [Chlamydomonas reinhardtii]